MPYRLGEETNPSSSMFPTPTPPPDILVGPWPACHPPSKDVFALVQ